MSTTRDTEQKTKKASQLSGWKSNHLVRLFLFVFLAGFLYAVLSGNLVPETYDLELNAKSEKTIYARKRLLNEAATEEARQKAAESVQAVYTYVPLSNLDLITSIYRKIRTINPDNSYTSTEKAEIYRTFLTSEVEWHLNNLLAVYEENHVYDKALLDEVRRQMELQLYRMPEEIFFQFTRLTPEDLREMEPVTKSIVSNLMSEPFTHAGQAREKVPELVNASQLANPTAREVVQEIARFALTPSRFYDEKARIEAVDAARNSVEPVYYEVGDVIVAEGEVITQEVYDLLESQGLLKEQANYGPQFGLFILTVLFVLLLYLFIRSTDLPIKHNNAQLLLFVIIFALNVLLMLLVGLFDSLAYPFIGFLAPVAMGSMLITILLDTRLAFIATILFSIIASIIYNGGPSEMIFDFRYGLVTAVVCFVSIFSIYKASQRVSILKAGFFVSLSAVLTVAAIILLMNQLPTRDLIFALSFAFGSGLVTSVLVVGLLPFFEVSFGILSQLKLVELSNPNHPLLRKLLTETPGTYHHSVMVGNLAEAAAEAIGADGLLCRVGAYYHDVGKTRRPSYFIENQGNMNNPHDSLDPALSASIIIAHARDGGEMLREAKMPRQLVDIAEQHHGTTLLKYFYHKALKQAEEEGGETVVKEGDFRYPGPKAQTKEAAIVGIADCVEAAVRSLRNPTIEQIGSMVDRIIKDRLEDGQFNECDLTLRELDVVGKALKETLLGIFHSRIEYPDLSGKS